ncbi:hypothetical protein H0H87_003317, partial [Tephrocybe sp. NHM501043]
MLSVHPPKASSFFTNLVALATRKSPEVNLKLIPGIFAPRKPPPDVVEFTDEMSAKITVPLQKAKRDMIDALARLEEYMKFMYDGEFDQCMTLCQISLDSIRKKLEAQNARKFDTVTTAMYKELVVAAEDQSLDSERIWTEVR